LARIPFAELLVDNPQHPPRARFFRWRFPLQFCFGGANLDAYKRRGFVRSLRELDGVSQNCPSGARLGKWRAVLRALNVRDCCKENFPTKKNDAGRFSDDRKAKVYLADVTQRNLRQRKLRGQFED